MVNEIFNMLKKITWKSWLLFLILSQAIYFIMLFITIPKIMKEAGGLKIFDMQPLGYTYDYAYEFLSHLTKKGFKIYKFIQLPLDILFPLLNCLLGISTIVLLINVYQKVKGKSASHNYSLSIKFMIFLPLVAMIADYIENIMIIIMLYYKLAVPKAVVSVANIFTLIKSMSTTLYYTISIFICIAIVMVWISNKILRSKYQRNL